MPSLTGRNLPIDRFFAGGRWVPASGEPIVVLDPATEQEAGTVTAVSRSDLDLAVDTARSALPSWSNSPLTLRLEALERLANEIERRADHIAALVSTEMGAPTKLARRINATLPATILRAHRELSAKVAFEEELGNSEVVREGVGVVAAITPWNYPIHQIIAKVAPALTAGCTIVVKPSEEAPLSTYLLAEIVSAAGLPAGVFNFVVGGPDIGAALVTHPGVDAVSFTGSTSTGRAIARAAADLVRPVTLELGGKSASVILDDADLKTAVKVSIANAFMNAGQTCNAWTRLVVPSSQLNEVRSLATTFAEQYTVGRPTDESTRMGPLVSAAQRQRVLGYVEQASADADLWTGGVDRPDSLDVGYYVRPTVFGGVDPESRLAQEEVFGPVIAVMSYESPDEALTIANNSSFGLGGGVWSSAPDRAREFAKNMQTGQIDINGAAFNVAAPFGGYKSSGIGREFGHHGIEEFLITKSIQS